MRRLTATAERDRGAVAIVVAILLPLVFIGMAALTVDVGNISAERRQLQNGADAVALSVAMDCARTGTCPVAAPDPEGLADGNAADGVSKIARVDGGTPVCGVGPGLTACPAVTPGLGECVQPSGPMPGKYVRVYTQTETKDGSTILPYFFAQAIVGGGSGGTTQQTCASVAWGTPNKLTTTIPFTIGMCEWNKSTSYGSTFAGKELAVALNTKGDTCATWNGHNYPGGFGWLDYDSNCQTDVTVDGWVSGNPGQGKGNHCSAQILNAVGTTVFFPVFDCFSNSRKINPCDFTANGQGAEYHVIGLAAFYLTGVDLPAVGSKHVSAQPTCAAGPPVTVKDAFSGCFVKAIIPVGSIDDSGNSPDLGLNVLQMMG